MEKLIGHPFTLDAKSVVMGPLGNVQLFLSLGKNHVVDFYVRQCYHEMFRQVSDTFATIQAVVLNGSPGIGKSTFFLYLLWRCLSACHGTEAEKRAAASASKVTHIIYHCAARGRTPVLFDLQNKTCTPACAEFEATDHPLNSASTLYICDAAEQDNPAWTMRHSAIRVMVITSPPENHFDRVVKDLVPTTLMMPPWTPEELIEAHKCLEHLLVPLSDVDISTRATTMGCAFRFVLPFLTETVISPEEYVSEHLQRCGTWGR